MGQWITSILATKTQLEVINRIAKSYVHVKPFFFYSTFQGVTGTLGSNEEHALFNKLYNDIIIVVIPTNKPSKLKIELPDCYPTSSKYEWKKAICTDIEEKLLQKRVVLLISEDMEGARYLYQCLKGNCSDLVILNQNFISVVIMKNLKTKVTSKVED